MNEKNSLFRVKKNLILNKIPQLKLVVSPQFAITHEVVLGLPMTSRCRKLLTNTTSYCVKVRAGLYDMGEKYSLQQAQAEVEMLTQVSRRKFRLGTPLELFLFHLQHKIPENTYCVCLSEMWNGLALCFDMWMNGSGFDVCCTGYGFKPYVKLFIVEEF